MVIYANLPPPQVPRKRSQAEASCGRGAGRAWGPWGCKVKGRSLPSPLGPQKGGPWVRKHSVSKWGKTTLFWWGLGLVALKNKLLLSRMYIFVGFFVRLFIFLRVLHSNMRDHGVKPRDLYQLIVLFVNLYK